MKNVILIISILFASVTTSFAQVAKHNGSYKLHHPNNSAKKYTCPMHPEVVRSRPGKCPKCGMQLVKMKHKNMGNKMGKMDM
jgi:Heavy metal binding domain